MPEVKLKPAQIPLDVIEVFNVLERKLKKQQLANEDKDNKILIRNIQNNTHINVYSPKFKIKKIYSKISLKNNN